MTNKSPVFPIPQQPHHFSDYGFDPQIDYLQVLEEARKHKKDSSRSLEAVHFKLQKPISKEDHHTKKNKNRKKKWWRNALLFWKWKWVQEERFGDFENEGRRNYMSGTGFSGPVYITESRSGSVTPCRMNSGRSTSGPISSTLTPLRKGDVEIPFVSLRELNMEQQQHRISTSTMPIYLVT
ncbi:hypothetical protein IFM89_022292 [Coptis chinensis]|uniref:Uncharacterized protein n=1 Tax=Coptis chinensis TaxID=261450 RepID=A0A835HXM9_9MAGN|nr:hypothetical protein IFM89_022292 [Coptis chinensis]